jgi:hypothetical protein
MPRVIAEDRPWVADGGITTSRGPVKFSLVKGVAVSEELEEEMARHLSAIPGYRFLTASRAKELFDIKGEETDETEGEVSDGKEETTPEKTLEQPDRGPEERQEESAGETNDPPSPPKPVRAQEKGKRKKK